MHSGVIPIVNDMVAGRTKYRAAGTQILGVDTCVQAVHLRPTLLARVQFEAGGKASSDIING